MHHHYETCIEACNACATACDECAAKCLKEDDVKMLAECIRIDVDCAQMCRLAAGYMARDSEFAHLTCELCAGICKACEAECGRHPHEHCQACAAACRQCADECLRIVGVGRAREGTRAPMSTQ